jgi:hypothetical protein
MVLLDQLLTLEDRLTHLNEGFYLVASGNDTAIIIGEYNHWLAL